MSKSKIFDVVSYFAKLMASDNITIKLQSIPTAMFNTKTRELFIPVFAESDMELSTFLVAHEVGHALFTPNDPTSNRTKLLQMICNVIEDYRVDLVMFAKYRGLPNVYSKGVKILNQRNFYGNDGQYDNTTKDLFLERLNIWLVQTRTDTNRYTVKFTNFEKELVRKCQTVSTFGDVLEVATIIENYLLSSEEEEPKQEPSDDGDDSSDQPSPDNSGDSDSNQQKKNGEPKQDDTNGKKSEEEVKNLVDKIEESFKKIQPKFEHSTLRNLHFELPSCEIVVIDDMYFPNNANVDSIKNLTRNLYKSFITKRTASKYSNIKQYDTGEINSNVLYDYKCRDDVFLSKDIIKNDTNHSLIFYLDVSSSMSQVFSDVKRSLYTLVDFCSLANIKFQVWSIGDVRMASKALKKFKNPKSGSFSNYVIPSLLFDSSSKAGIRRSIMSNLTCDSGNTPLEGSLLSSLPFALEFNKKHKIEKCRCIVLTDGEGNRPLSPTDWNYDSFVFNSINKKYYTMRGENWSNQSFIFDTVESYLNAQLIWIHQTSRNDIYDKRQINVTKEELYDNPKIFIKTLTDRIA